MIKSKHLSIQLYKDIIHSILPLFFALFLPHSWNTLALLYVYFIIKFYFYIIKSKIKTDIAVIGFFFHAAIVAAYLAGM